jgi:hypothetical protein
MRIIPERTDSSVNIDVIELSFFFHYLKSYGVSVKLLDGIRIFYWVPNGVCLFTCFA